VGSIATVFLIVVGSLRTHDDHAGLVHQVKANHNTLPAWVVLSLSNAYRAE
jgi:hypothetical protein